MRLIQFFSFFVFSLPIQLPELYNSRIIEEVTGVDQTRKINSFCFLFMWKFHLYFYLLSLQTWLSLMPTLSPFSADTRSVWPWSWPVYFNPQGENRICNRGNITQELPQSICISTGDNLWWWISYYSIL